MQLVILYASVFKRRLSSSKDTGNNNFVIFLLFVHYISLEENHSRNVTTYFCSLNAVMFEIGQEDVAANLDLLFSCHICV